MYHYYMRIKSDFSMELDVSCLTCVSVLQAWNYLKMKSEKKKPPKAIEGKKVLLCLVLFVCLLSWTEAYMQVSRFL